MAKITISGQLYKDEDSASYCYPPDEDHKWQENITPDPRVDLQILGCKRYYALWQNEYGFYYAFSKYLPTRAGGDAALIVALCDKSVNNGAEFVKCLEAILSYCIEKESSRQISDEDISKQVKQLEDLLSSDENPEFCKINGDRLPDGYCLYNNESELIKILQNPIQEQYGKINRLFIIDGQEDSSDHWDARSALTEIPISSIKENIHEAEEKQDVTNDSDNTGTQLPNAKTDGIKRVVGNFVTFFTKKIPVWMCLVVFIIGLAIGTAAGYLWKTKESQSGTLPEEENPSIETATSETEIPSIGEGEGGGNEERLTPEKMEALDIIYLTNNPLWELDSLQSEKYKDFLCKELIENKKHIQEHKEIKNESWDSLYVLITKNRTLFREKKNSFCDSTCFDLTQAIQMMKLEPNNKGQNPVKHQEGRVSAM